MDTHPQPMDYDPLRLILRYSGGTSSQFLKGSLHSQTQFYLGCEGKGGGCGMSYYFVCTIFLY